MDAKAQIEAATKAITPSRDTPRGNELNLAAV